MNSINLMPEETGINLKNEGSLHSAIKTWYARHGDRLEVRVDGSIVDIVRDGLLIEIQTAGFGSIKRKLRTLVKSHPIHLVHPIPEEKWITRLSASGNEVLSRRRSPKRGCLADLFTELLRIPDLINEDNFSIEVLMVKVEEIRCEDGKGSWRRKGVSIKDRRLLDVTSQICFTCKRDFLSILPEGLCQPFSNKILAKAMKIPVNKAQKTTYCLKKMGVIKQVGKTGKELLYEIVS